MYIPEYTHIHTSIFMYIHTCKEIDTVNNTTKRQKEKYGLRFACKRMRLVISDTENVNVNCRKYQKCEKFAVHSLQK